jgi:hypothetical protein
MFSSDRSMHPGRTASAWSHARCFVADAAFDTIDEFFAAAHTATIGSNNATNASCCASVRWCAASHCFLTVGAAPLSMPTRLQ